MANSTSNGAGGKDVLRLLAQALTPYLRHQLNSAPPTTHQEYYDQKTSPLGRRKHMALVRRGVLQGYKHGKSVFVLRKDVHEFIQSHVSKTAHEECESSAGEQDDLEDWGLRRRK